MNSNSEVVAKKNTIQWSEEIVDASLGTYVDKRGTSSYQSDSRVSSYPKQSIATDR